MAKIELLTQLILKWEGGFVNDPVDRGGATNMGITIATWRSVGYDKDGDGLITANDMKLLTKKDFEQVLKLYWNRWLADKINDQQLANILVDWVWGSGKWGITIPQRLLGVTVDGIVGAKTIAAVNAENPVQLHQRIWGARYNFLEQIVRRDKSQKRFFKGWINRLNDFKRK